MSDLFAQINDVWGGSDSLTTSSKIESMYMTNRFLSLHPDGFLSASDCNRFRNIPEWAGMQFLKYSTPNIRAPRMKYPKSLAKKEKLTKKKKNALMKICRRFHVTEYHGTQILNLLEKQGIKLETY
jgi:hypothetical protein